MLVTRPELENVAEKLQGKTFLALDTETTGLYAFKEDRIFSLIIADHTDQYYFNFQMYPGISKSEVLDRQEVYEFLQPLFRNPSITWFMHNAKFDMWMLHADGVELAGNIHCTMATGRVLYNKHMSYAMARMAKEIGYEKDDTVTEYIKKNKLYEMVQRPGKATKTKDMHFDQVPLELVQPYGDLDGKITMELGIYQLEKLSSDEKLHAVFENEKKLTKVCFEMEKVGIQVDMDFVQKALAHEQAIAYEADEMFVELAGCPLIDSAKTLVPVFEYLELPYGKIKAGRPSFDDESLAKVDHDISKILRKYRSAMKKANTYYENFLYYADDKGVLHANIRQSGTDTGRFSYSDPNLQNLPKEEKLDEEFVVRRSFVPREDYCFVMIDYDQQEYKLMLDYANETKLIGKILNDGLDVHQATADMMGVDRRRAKTLNFMILYGGGIAKLAGMLDISERDAKKLRSKYFDALPKIPDWTRKVISAAEGRGYVFNWLGRKCHFDKGFEYKAPNHLIQGGCADVVKVAMNRIHEFLKTKKSRMLVQIHDEILLEVHKDELRIVEDVKSIMEKAYPFKHIPLTCGVDHSWKSWADKEKGAPK